MGENTLAVAGASSALLVIGERDGGTKVAVQGSLIVHHGLGQMLLRAKHLGQQMPYPASSNIRQRHFHWNNVRKAWQHPRGRYRDQQATYDPRHRYGSYFRTRRCYPYRDKRNLAEMSMGSRLDIPALKCPIPPCSGNK